MILRRVSAVVAVDPASVPRSFPAPPAWTPGRCHHDLHAHYQGHRIGLTVFSNGQASWLACPHIGKDGRP